MKTFLMIFVCFIIGLAITVAINAGLVWLITWALVKIGITTIFGWTVAFSWPLVIIFSIIVSVLKSTFSVTTKGE